MDKVTIMVRNRVRAPSGQYECPMFCTEWFETVHSWKKAWAIVDECGPGARKDVVKWNPDTDDAAFFFLDIGGLQEKAAKARYWARWDREIEATGTMLQRAEGE